MRVALGADHAGVALKTIVAAWLESRHLPYQDFGTDSEHPIDYPDIAATVARGVAAGTFDRGILICGSGIGVSIAANKVHGVRAACVVDEETARLSREHNDANVVALGARVLLPERALAIVETFLATPFAAGRHERRVQKITALEHYQDEPGPAAR